MNAYRRFLRAGALSAALALAMSTSVNAAIQSPVPAARFSTSSLQQGQSYDRFIVTYRPGSAERRDHAAAVQNVSVAIARSGLNRSTLNLNGQAVPALGVTWRRKLAVGADLLQTTRKLSDTEAAALMRQIASDPAVQFVEPDAVMHPIKSLRTSAVRRAAAMQPQAFPQDPPDDSKYQQYQWDFFNATGGVDAPAAWALADGTGVTVAVLDTGLTKNADIDYSLGDSGYDFLSSKDYSGRTADGRAAGGWDTGDWTTANECGNGSTAEDSSWHGTHVSGTIAALTNNGVALAGMAGMARVLPVRVLGHCGGPTSDIADGIVWAAGGHVDGVPDNTNPAKVISMSLGGGGYCYSDSAFAVAIKQANDLGAAVVVAAGNDGSNTENYQPASCPGVIAVGATGIDGGKAQYSNYGTAVALAAPGGGICPDDRLPDTGGSCGGVNPRDDGFVWSLVNSGTTTPVDDVGDGYVYFGGMAGTSQATPHVSATLALILDAVQSAGLPAPTPAQLKGYLTDSVRPFPILPPSGTPIGPGILDAAAAINLALGNDPGEQVTALTNAVPVGNLYGAAGDDMLFSLDVPAGAHNLSLRSFGGMGDVSLYVSKGHAPTADSHDYQSVRSGNNESVVIGTPQPGTYYILVKGVTTFRDLGVLGNYSP